MDIVYLFAQLISHLKNSVDFQLSILIKKQ